MNRVALFGADEGIVRGCEIAERVTIGGPLRTLSQAEPRPMDVLDFVFRLLQLNPCDASRRLRVDRRANIQSLK